VGPFSARPTPISGGEVRHDLVPRFSLFLFYGPNSTTQRSRSITFLLVLSPHSFPWSFFAFSLPFFVLVEYNLKEPFKSKLFCIIPSDSFPFFSDFGYLSNLLPPPAGRRPESPLQPYVIWEPFFFPYLCVGHTSPSFQEASGFYQLRCPTDGPPGFPSPPPFLSFFPPEPHPGQPLFSSYYANSLSRLFSDDVWLLHLFLPYSGSSCPVFLFLSFFGFGSLFCCIS